MTIPIGYIELQKANQVSSRNNKQRGKNEQEGKVQP